MRSNRGLSNLAKFVIAMGIFIAITGVGLLTAGIFFVHSLTDPENIKSTAATFMKIREPLPHGFHYMSGYTVGSIPVVQIRDDEEQTLYSFSASNRMTRQMNAETLIRKADDGHSSVIIGKQGPGNIDVHSRGHITVAGQSMPYAIGPADLPLNPDKTSVNVFFGAVDSNTTKRVVVLWIQKNSSPLRQAAEPITLDRIKELTDNIESL